MPDGEGKIILLRSCAGCHALTVVTSKRATAGEWNSIVQQMVTRGAQGTDREFTALTAYLVTNFGPHAPQYLLPSTVHAASIELPPDEKPTPRPASKVHVNVNRVGIKELVSMLGLTAGEAKTLIDYRRHNGPFRNWQEVGEIPGVPAGKIIDFQDRIVF